MTSCRSPLFLCRDRRDRGRCVSRLPPQLTHTYGSRPAFLRRRGQRLVANTQTEGSAGSELRHGAILTQRKGTPANVHRLHRRRPSSSMPWRARMVRRRGPRAGGPSHISGLRSADGSRRHSRRPPLRTPAPVQRESESCRGGRLVRSGGSTPSAGERRARGSVGDAPPRAAARGARGFQPIRVLKSPLAELAAAPSRASP